MSADGTRRFQDRLASAGTSDEALAILGRRRVLFFDLVLTAIALSFSALTCYFFVSVVMGWNGPWVLGWTLGLLPLSLFADLAAVSAMRRRITGRTRPPSKRMARIYDRLNSNI
jgi:hypothetical protein